MSRYTQIDLSGLPAPNIIESLDYESIFQMLKDACGTVMPEMAPVLALDSEPATKVLQVCAGFILLTRSRVNDAAKGVLLAYAVGSDLDHLGALLGVQRLVLVPANPDALVPQVEVLEDDTAFRARIQLSLEGFSTAGPRGAYEYHARSASAQIKDVLIAGPDTVGVTVTPGTVMVFVLAHPSVTYPQGVPDGDLLALVNTTLSADDIRPLNDNVEVYAAEIVEYTVVAELEVYPGPDSSTVLTAAQDALTAYLDSVHAMGTVVARSGIHAALHQSGVARVNLTFPAADVEPGPNEAAFCTAVSITTTVI